VERDYKRRNGARSYTKSCLHVTNFGVDASTERRSHLRTIVFLHSEHSTLNKHQKKRSRRCQRITHEDMGARAANARCSAAPGPLLPSHAAPTGSTNPPRTPRGRAARTTSDDPSNPKRLRCLRTKVKLKSTFLSCCSRKVNSKLLRDMVVCEGNVGNRDVLHIKIRDSFACARNWRLCMQLSDSIPSRKEADPAS
jgi:hypothetical protein